METGRRGEAEQPGPASQGVRELQDAPDEPQGFLHEVGWEVAEFQTQAADQTGLDAGAASSCSGEHYCFTSAASSSLTKLCASGA